MKINFKKDNIKQFIVLVLSVVLLSLITYSNHPKSSIERIKANSNIDLINGKLVSPKDLFLECYHTIKHDFYHYDLNKQNFSKWKKRYVNEIKSTDDAIVAINTMLASLDDSYSRFMSEEEFLNQNNAINSKLYGIGINIATLAGKTYVINVLEGAPAYTAGIKRGDIILKVNKTDIKGQSISETAQLIKGDLNNSLELELLRGNEKFQKTVKREEIKIKTIDYKTTDDNIGYIRISSFIGANTAAEFIITLNRLKDTNGLILDLRGNSGGLFQNAILISNLFMNKGTIVSVIARQNKKNIYSAKNEGCIYTKPLVVLIDEDTASASEIVSSALHDNNRATLIGTRTYGKGLVQKVYSMPNKTGLNLTIARYITPKGADINKKGIEPDYKVSLLKNDLINNTDSQFEYAHKFLVKKIENEIKK